MSVNDSSHRAVAPTRLASQSSFSCCSHLPNDRGEESALPSDFLVIRDISWTHFNSTRCCDSQLPCQVLAGLQFNLCGAAKDRTDRTDHCQLTKHALNTKLQLEDLIVSPFTAICSLFVEEKKHNFYFFLEAQNDKVLHIDVSLSANRSKKSPHCPDFSVETQGSVALNGNTASCI